MYRTNLILEELRNYLIINNKENLVSDENEDIRLYIEKFLNGNCGRYKINKNDIDGLSQKLLLDICEYSFLTKLLNDKEIEEININSYNNILITYSNGEIKNSEEIFYSPKHAVDIIRKLLRNSNMIIDSSKPIARGFLKKNIRITAFLSPLVDKEIGVVASIRIINPKKLTKNDFLKNKTLNKDMLSLLINLVNANVSICCSGATNSGKTTMMSLLLNEAKENKRIITIENEVREFNLSGNDNDKLKNVKSSCSTNNQKLNGEIGNVGSKKLDKKIYGQSNIVHLVTRDSSDENKKITQEKLLEYALTSNPDIICIAESKSHEAFYAQEAARTGHGVITTVHANSCKEVYKRLLTLCKEKSNIKDELLTELLTEAFPITFFMKKFKDGSRKITEIAEYVREDGVNELRTLYLYKNNRFVKVNDLSKRLSCLIKDKNNL